MLWALLIARFAFGACADIDHSDHFGAIRDQGSLAWCFANSSADLLGEYLHLRPPDEISAFDVAVAYLAPDRLKVSAALSKPEVAGKIWQSGSSVGEELSALLLDYSYKANYGQYAGKNLSDREGGIVGRAPAALFVAGGYCLESRLPSRPLKGQANHPVWEADRDPEGRDLVRGEIERTERDRKVSGLLEPTCTKVAFGLMPELVDPKLRNSITELALREVRRSIDERCGQRHPFRPPEAKQSSFDPALLQRVLASGKSMEVTYNITPLVNPLSRDELEQGGSIPHSSLVIGMRKAAGGSCEYHIRNSWGADCAAYDPDLARDCKNGAFWVNEKLMSKLTQSLTQFL